MYKQGGERDGKAGSRSFHISSPLPRRQRPAEFFTERAGLAYVTSFGV